MIRENLQHYWNQRFNMFGHTGWKIPVIYEYDQRIRLTALKKLFLKKNITLNKKNMLDIGCGTGDFVYEFAKLGANITGCDISNELVKKTKERFSNFDNVKIYCRSVENLNLPKNYYDIITSITVLQHVVPEEKLLMSLNNLYDLLKTNGYLLLFESIISETKKNKSSTQDFYISIKTSSEWIAILEKSGFEFILSRSYPEFALQFLEKLREIRNCFYMNTKSTENDEECFLKHSNVEILLIKIIFALFLPIDRWLAIPFPKKYSSRMFYLFRKISPTPSR